ncbi:hypothetical protein [Rhodoplanes sp. SY1]|uniref:hypothetical protein n=1 Tax=Rhodoplanes sp. SY1 TaxID=3166646 RepID=UPI0038B49EBC
MILRPDQEPGSNRLLGALEKASRRRVDAYLEPLTLELGTVVCEAGGSSITPIFHAAQFCRC